MTDLNEFSEAREQMNKLADTLPDDPEAARAAQIAAVEAAAAAPQAAVPAMPAVEPPPDVPAAAPATDPVPEVPPAEPPVSGHVPLSRFNEINEDRNRLREENERLMRARLAEVDAARAAPADDPNAPPPLSPEVKEYMTNTLRAMGFDIDEYARLKQSIQPVAEQQEMAAAGRSVASLVPGFDPANFGQVIDYARSMPNVEERELYLGSPAGAVALAARMMLEGKFGGPQAPAAAAPAAPPPPVPRRPMASGISGSPVVGPDDNEQQKAQRVAAMSSDEIMSMLDRMTGARDSMDIGNLLKP